MKISRVCPGCGKQHDTVVENVETKEVISYVDKCIDCLMAKCGFNPLNEQIILTKDDNVESI